MSSADAGLFHREYEAELDAWLQRRFGYLCVTFAVIEVLLAAWSIVWLTVAHGRVDTDTSGYWLGLASSLAGLAVVSAFMLRHMGQVESRPKLIQATTWLILSLGALALAESVAARWWLETAGVGVLARLFLWHFTACLILPWHPGESVRPMVPLMLLWAFDVLAGSGGSREALVGSGVGILFSPAILLPGMVISGVRMHMHGRRFRTEMLGRQFLRLRRELLQARTLHESMFPRPHDDGHVRFDYQYMPARDVGGDFIHLFVGPTGIVSFTLIDVTGHGIAAALTVNRLYGELERIRAENPRIQPAELLTLLNRYVHLTLARHSVYATAVSADLDPYVGHLRYASAGHPPLVLRRAAGSVTQLDSSGMILGAVGDDAFECEQLQVELEPGDTVVAYTDGAFEAMSRRGEQLGAEKLVDALRRTPAPGNWPQFLAALVERHSGGRPQDDVLVASLTFVSPRTAATRFAPASKMVSVAAS